MHLLAVGADFPNAVVAGRYRVAGWPRARAGLIWNVGT